MKSKRDNRAVDADMILAQVKNKVKKNNYERNTIHFSDVQTRHSFASDIMNRSFDLEQFKINLLKMGDDRNIAVFQNQLTENKMSAKVKVFVKQILYRLMRFYVQPIAESQSRYNEECLQAIVQLYAMIEQEQQKEIDSLKDRLNKLETDRKGETCG